MGIHAAADTEYDWPLVRQAGGRVLPQPPGRHADRDGRRARTPTDPSTAGPPGPLDAATDEWYNYKAPSNPSSTAADDYSPRSTAGRARPAQDGRVDLRRGRRLGRRRRRPPDLVVPALRRRPLVVHGPRPHAGVVRRGRASCSHIAAGIEIAAGVLPSAACGVAPSANADPVISAATATPSSGVAPLPVTFAATATDADGDALTYTWDLDGNGSFETTGQNPSFTYTTAGLFSPVVKVTDARGASVTKTLTVSVSPPAATGTDVPVQVGGTVPSVLSLDAGHRAVARHLHAGRGPRLHGVARGDRDVEQHGLGTERARPECDRTGAARERDAGTHLTSAVQGGHRSLRGAQRRGPRAHHVQ